MKGDFSRWDSRRDKNFAGVLHQQGRVLLDSDWNDQGRITGDWQDQAGQDIVGANVAAVPATEPDGFKVTRARVISAGDGDRIELTIQPGRVWIDGLLTYLDSEEEVVRIATYMKVPGPPIAVGTRDAVVLEVWREAVNAFQMPEELIEPALGGSDTTERVLTSYAFRLLRLGKGNTCKDAREKLGDDLSKRGKLKVSLQPTVVVDGNCPVVKGGGYTGFEHNLYRVEIAKVKAGTSPMFKWSQFNGGLVGRGKFDSVQNKVDITANLQAIVASGLFSFYLEVVAFNEELDHWEVTYGAEANLNSDNEIDLPAPGGELFGSMPSSGSAVFFRLWDGIKLLSDFPNVVSPGEPKELRDGIRLEFTNSASSVFTPGDYWTFPVRADEIGNDEVLIDNEFPHGVLYHRVPLAILTWDNDRDIGSGEGQIHDCRRIFHALSDRQACCTVMVGDGVNSQGHFNDIQEAINHLPEEGGQVCILPGQHRTDAKIEGKKNVVIKGCGKHTVIFSETDERMKKYPTDTITPLPIFTIRNSQNITLESMTLMADQGEAVLLEGKAASPKVKEINGETGRPVYERVVDDSTLKQVMINDNKIVANAASAIRGTGGKDIHIINNEIYMLDRGENVPGIFLTAEESSIESNLVTILKDIQPSEDTPDIEHNHPKDIEIDPCGHLFYNKMVYLVYTVMFAFISEAEHALGGIQIGGTSEKINIANNRIIGGNSNGITLGSLETVRAGKLVSSISKGSLSDIRISGNTVQNMGLNGIGMAGLFNLDKVKTLVTTDRISITDNEITGCLSHIPEDFGEEKIQAFAGILLADGEHMVIRDNRIEGNGKLQLQPVCGIFIFHGEGIDISGNWILDNGPGSGTDVRKGLRGGIVIKFGTVSGDRIEIGNVEVETQDGFPAVKLHDNVVMAPLGHALLLGAKGPVSAVGNQFTSRGVLPKDVFPLLAGTVLILNLGTSSELFYPLFRYSRLQNAKGRKDGKIEVRDNRFVIEKEQKPSKAKIPTMGNGNVLFSNNQCVLDLAEKGVSLSYSSVMIISADNVNMHNNELNCNLVDDMVISNSILLAPSVLSSDNRLKTMFFNEFFSMISFGFANVAMDNIGTHCFLVMGPKKKSSNIVVNDFWIDRIIDGGCAALNEIIEGMLQKLAPGTFGGMIHG